ncbi:MAG: helix-turn-helix transcriptional regulator [Clostridia bacterium]|nr:helix-turn-helix transcriptional regulator [Clostridia bacterium]
MFDNYRLGNRVALLRQQANLSQEKLAELAELSTEYISQIERGMKNPTVRSVQKICDALGVRLSDFFREESSAPDFLDTQIEGKLRSKSGAEKEMILKQLDLLEQYKNADTQP